MFGLETVVELLGDLVHVKCGSGAGGDVYDGDLVLFIETDCDLVEALDEWVAGLPDIETMVTAGEGFTWFAPDPLPDLPACGLFNIDDEVLASGLGDLMVDLQACGSVGDRRADEGNESTFLGDSGQLNGSVINGDVKLGFVAIPAQVFKKECLEIE
jgi:hypothetical protein